MSANLTSMAVREPSAVVGAVPVAGRAPAAAQAAAHGQVPPDGPGSDPPRIAGAVPTDVIELERAFSQIAYLITRRRQHDRTAVEAGVPVSRAAVPILRLLAESPSLRPGEIAARLEVEPPHIARQVHLLERAGYAESVPDPGDRRAHTVRLTPAGRDAIGRISQAGRQQMLKALASWSPQELQQLATLISRMADDFSAFAASEGIDVPARAEGSG
jgi:DNA-binding MarR family transcriptional regulator